MQQLEVATMIYRRRQMTQMAQRTHDADDALGEKDEANTSR
jgi:hypothetical protein